MSTGFGAGPFGFDPFGGGTAAPVHGRVYAKVTPDLGAATLAASQTAKATLAASPQGFAKLSPSAGFSTLQTD